MSLDNSGAVELLIGTSLHISSSREDIPRNAIKAGLSPCGQVYVGVVCHEGIVMPAKIVPAYNLCYYSYNGSEYNTTVKTYLTVEPGYTYKWIQMDRIRLPRNAAVVQEGEKDPYYFGRVIIDGEKCVGKIIESSATCLVPKTGREFTFEACDVLIIEKIRRIGM